MASTATMRSRKPPTAESGRSRSSTALDYGRNFVVPAENRGQEFARLVREGLERAERKSVDSYPVTASWLEDDDNDEEEEEEEKQNQDRLRQKEKKEKHKSRRVKITSRKSKKNQAENAASTWEDAVPSFAWVQGFWENQGQQEEEPPRKGAKSQEKASAMTNSAGRARTRSLETKSSSGLRHAASPIDRRRRKSSTDKREREEARSSLPDVSTVASSLGNLVTYVGGFFEQEPTSPGSRARSRSSWREAYASPETSRPALARPSWSDRLAVFKQRVLHGDSGESAELQGQFDGLVHLRARIAATQSRLEAQIGSAVGLLEALAQHHNPKGRHARREVRDAAKRLQSVIDEVSAVTYFADTITEIDAALEYRKLLKHHRRVWDRHIRKSKHLLEAVDEDAIESMPFQKRRQLEEAIGAQERYDEATEKVSHDMANLLAANTSEKPITDELQEAQFSVFMSWRTAIRDELEEDPERAQRGSALYQRAWVVYAQNMSSPL